MSKIKSFKKSFKVRDTRLSEMVISSYSVTWGLYFSMVDTRIALTVSQVVETINLYGGKYLWCSLFVLVGIAQFLGVHYHYPRWRNWAARVGMAIWSTAGSIILFTDKRLVLMWIMCFINFFICFTIQLHRTAELSE